MGAIPNDSHYSAAVREGNTLYISGQLPLDPVTRQACRGDAREQTLQALKNIQSLAQQEFGKAGKVVRTTAYIAGMELWDEVNAAYAEFFGNAKPARSIVGVSEIHFGFLVEIEAIIMGTESDENMGE